MPTAKHENLSPLPARSTSTYRILFVAGVILLLLWAWLWHTTLTAPVPRFPVALKTWLSVFPFVGLDFSHNYAAGRAWVAGADPYIRIIGDPQYTRYGYAPEVLPFFAWCIFFKPDLEFAVPSPPLLPGSNGYLLLSSSAVIVWTLTIASFCILATLAVWQFRRKLPISSVPLPFMLASVLLSLPVILEMERGNCNALALILVVFVVILTQQKSSWTMDLVTAICLAFAIWIKAYAVFAVLAIVAARRYRVIGLCLVAGLLMMAVWWRETMIFATSLHKSATTYNPPVVTTLHPLVIIWSQLTDGTPLALIPPMAAGVLLILLPMVVLMYALWRANKGAVMLLPAALWCTAAGTYLPHVSHDYNYISFLLLVLAVWDKRDPFWVHAVMGIVLMWWQPFEVGISPHVVFWAKLFSLYAMGYCLLRRAYELDALEKQLPMERVSVFKRAWQNMLPAVKTA